ncbi:MAG: FixH family protein [Alphaproteobacteria bacterium]
MRMVRLPGSPIPWIFVACMGLVVAVNAGMVAAAISTYSGLAHDNAFGRGLAYNRVLEAQERQDGLGWRVEVELGAPAGDDGARVLRLRLGDAAGAALEQARAPLELRRPVERVAPVVVALEARGPGEFEGRVVLARAGQFDARVVVQRGADRLDATRRIVAR